MPDQPQQLGDVAIGARIGKLLRDNGLSYGQAAIKCDNQITRTYWGSLIKGSQRVTRRTLDIIHGMFPEEDISDLYEAKGWYPPPALRPQEEAGAAAKEVGEEPGTYTASPSAYPVPPTWGAVDADDMPGVMKYLMERTGFDEEGVVKEALRLLAAEKGYPGLKDLK